MSTTIDRSQHSLVLLGEELGRRWQIGPDRVAEMCRHALVPSGKLLRPLLLLESAAAVGADREKVVPAALAMEYLHVASLVHDDVIDADDVRRGRPSVVARYGMADAIVTGDALFMHSFAALAECADRGVAAGAVVRALRVLGDCGVRLCRGQVAEGQQQGMLDAGVPAYLEMIGLKTGALFRAVCVAGVILGDGTLAQEATVDKYASHLGRAFQMYDDLLPYLRDTATTGKPAGSDLANQRATFPVLIGHDMADAAQREQIAEVLRGAGVDALARMGDLLRELGAIERARRLAVREAELAVEALAGLPESASTDFLASVARISVDRDR